MVCILLGIFNYKGKDSFKEIQIQILKSCMYSLLKLICLTNTSMINGLCQFFIPPSAFSWLPFSHLMKETYGRFIFQKWQQQYFRSLILFQNFASTSSRYRVMSLPFEPRQTFLTAQGIMVEVNVFSLWVWS